MKIALPLLGFLVATLAYFAATNTNVYDGNKGLYAPNVMHRIALPCPPACDQDLNLKGLDSTGIVTVGKDKGVYGPGAFRQIYHVYKGTN